MQQNLHVPQQCLLTVAFLALISDCKCAAQDEGTEERNTNLEHLACNFQIRKVACH
jgi:hypothetical protein